MEQKQEEGMEEMVMRIWKILYYMKKSRSIFSFSNYFMYLVIFSSQESGRAGRDGKPAKCIIFWRFGDLARQSTMVFTEQTGLENLYGLIAYCLDGVK